MKPRGKLTLTLLLALAAALLLSGTSAGDFEADFTVESLDEVMARYIAERELTEDSFAMGWYDLATGSEWFFNADTFMVAGSMYKLPLNMVYADKLASGDVNADDMVGVYTVERAMELSIVYSDNDAADALHSALRLSQRDYRLLLSQYSGLDETELPEEYFTDNHISARFMINTLVYLYDNSELYGGLIGHMKSAHPGRYFKKSEGEYEIAHKYGYFEGGLDDCGIVYSPRPFALVVFTNRVRGGEDILSELCALMTGYSLYLNSLPETQYTPPLGPADSHETETEANSEPEIAAAPAEADTAEHVVGGAGHWRIYGAFCALLLGTAALRRTLARRHTERRRRNER